MLLKDNAVTADTWTYVDGDTLPDGTGPFVLPPVLWRDNQTHGLLLEGDSEPEAEFVAAPLIAIRFPAFNDGRGLSLAVLLRTRFSYANELRAIGDVQPDILNYMARCGFDSYLLTENKDPDTALSLLKVHSGYYQGSVTEHLPAFRRIGRG